MRLNVHAFGPEDGEPVLALHGVTGHGRRYVHLAAAALPDRRALAVDLRGHGRSGWDPPWDVATHLADLLETLDAEGVSAPVDVLGHSFGGLLGLGLVATAPELVRRAVLLDPAIALPAAVCRQRAEAAAATAGWASMEDALAARREGIAESGQGFLAEEVAEHVEERADGRFWSRFSPPAAAVAWSEMSRPAPIPATPRPILVVRALRDDYVQDAALLAPLERAIGADLEVVGIDVQHILYWEALDETADEVRRFLS
ncbi:MAG: alpha/beta fold hydrolase [Actinomycetota bacterium]